MKEISMLESERMILRGITKDDTDIIVQWRSNPLVYRYFLSPHAITKQEHLDWYQNNYCADKFRCDWMAIEKETGQCLGVFGVRQDKGMPEVAEVNYLLAPGVQGRGFAGEAVCTVMAWAKKTWSCKSMLAEIHRENCSSIRLAERLGFIKDREEGDFCIYKRGL